MRANRKTSATQALAGPAIFDGVSSNLVVGVRESYVVLAREIRDSEPLTRSAPHYQHNEEWSRSRINVGAFLLFTIQCLPFQLTLNNAQGYFPLAPRYIPCRLETSLCPSH